MSERNEEELKRIRASLDEAKRTVFQLERRFKMLEEQQRLYREQTKVASMQPQVEEKEISVAETIVTDSSGLSKTEQTEQQEASIELSMEI